MKDTAVILAAAGTSQRFGNPFLKKVYATLNGRPVWQHSATVFSNHLSVLQVILVIHPDDLEMVRNKFSATIAMLGCEIALGGNERWQSVQNALVKLKPEVRYIAVHDAARPLISEEDFDSVLLTARKDGAAILGSPIYGTVKRTDNESWIEATVPRERLFQAATPQVFQRDLLEKAYQSKSSGAHPTDDAQLVESSGHRVRLVPGDPMNIKITTSDDLRWAELALKAKVGRR